MRDPDELGGLPGILDRGGLDGDLDAELALLSASRAAPRQALRAAGSRMTESITKPLRVSIAPCGRCPPPPTLTMARV